jgi:nucleoside-diphosphate-sugar epimerase
MRAYAAANWATALRPAVIYGDRDRQFIAARALLLSRVSSRWWGRRNDASIVHAAGVADGVVRAATRRRGGESGVSGSNDFDVTVRRFFELAGEGLGRRIRFVKLPTPLARGTLRAVKAITRALTGGKMSVVSSASLAWLTRDNPFTSERARAELGWAPSVRPEAGVPEAFRWWRKHR